MKRLLTGLAAASLLIGVPLAAAAHDRDDHRRGWERHSYGGHGHWNKPRHVVHHYRPAAPVAYYPAPRVVYRPAYVPVPAPVVAYPVVDGPRVSVGFRILF
jgi:hypothetical protein